MLRDAEIAMHRAKKGGKSRCELFDSAMHSQAVKRLQIESDLRKGIAQDELKVFYQPIVCLHNGRIVGFEALSRWQRPGGIVMPGEFIDVADETGLIVPINRQLISEACHNLKSWRVQYPWEPPLFISVNIPPRQFAHPNLAHDIAEILGQAGIEPGGLELEILETVAMGDSERANQILAELKAVGVSLSIDDFGTGYSSLSRLQYLPINTVKIDRSFITPLDERTASREIVRTIILLAHAIGLKVVAEGVETEKQAQVLRALECDLAQGYFFGRPENANSVGTLLLTASLAQRAR
jgi:EAL domain-containing protein (putative c-di-GMP-specific phosphodiesterase class I)